jgi:hypothetical protein
MAMSLLSGVNVDSEVLQALGDTVVDMKILISKIFGDDEMGPGSRGGSIKLGRICLSLHEA